MKLKTQICTLHLEELSSYDKTKENSQNIPSSPSPPAFVFILTHSDSLHLRACFTCRHLLAHTSTAVLIESAAFTDTPCMVTSDSSTTTHFKLYPAKTSLGGVISHPRVEKLLPFDYVSQLRHVLIFPSVSLSFTQPSSMLC